MCNEMGRSVSLTVLGREWQIILRHRVKFKTVKCHCRPVKMLLSYNFDPDEKKTKSLRMKTIATEKDFCHT